MFILGLSMLLLLFAAIFLVISHKDGVDVAICVFGLTVGIVAWVCLASYFLTV